MADVYYDPEQFGLETVAELDLSEPNYSFDLLVVWRRTSDGQLLYDTDEGCSCPSPFEGRGMYALKEFSWTAIEDAIAGSEAQATDVADFKAAIEKVAREHL